MKKVIAYGPEILALEDYFDGKTIILNGYQRFFVLQNSTLYCNITESTNGWVAARLYELSDADLKKFRDVFPDTYVSKEIQIDERNIDPLVETAETYIGIEPNLQVPLTDPREIAYTLYENLSIAVSQTFASKFALSTHAELTQSEMPLVTSYFKDLDEICLLDCRKQILSE